MFDWLKKKKTPYEREMEMYEEPGEVPVLDEEDDYFLYEMLEDD